MSCGTTSLVRPLEMELCQLTEMASQITMQLRHHIINTQGKFWRLFKYIREDFQKRHYSHEGIMNQPPGHYFLCTSRIAQLGLLMIQSSAGCLTCGPSCPFWCHRRNSMSTLCHCHRDLQNNQNNITLIALSPGMGETQN